MSTYLVTGAAGFIGSNLCRALLGAGHDVRGVDNFVTGLRDNLVGLDALDLTACDISQDGELDAVLSGVDFVLHQAAIPSVPRSIADPVATHQANAAGTLMLLEACRRASVKRVVYASSSSAYGDSPTLPKVETMPANPRSPYAVSKLAGEHYCRVYTSVFNVPCVALRYFNVFGPNQDPASAYAAVVPNFIQCALRGENPPIYGDGKQTRDFTYVDNVIEANLKACRAANAMGEVFNIACGRQVSLLELLDTINEILGTRVEPDLQPPRPGDVRDSLADVSRAKQVLGYTASIGLEEGLRRSIPWYRRST